MGHGDFLLCSLQRAKNVRSITEHWGKVADVVALPGLSAVPVVTNKPPSVI